MQGTFAAAADDQATCPKQFVLAHGSATAPVLESIEFVDAKGELRHTASAVKTAVGGPNAAQKGSATALAG